jgi:hypothetical protein
MMRTERENQCCIARGTPVLLGNGVSMPIEALVADVHARGSVDVIAPVAANGKPCARAGKCTAAWFVGAKACVELVLDDGRALVCTPDHRIMTAAGQWVEAQALRVGQSRVVVAPAIAAVDARTLARRVIARNDAGVHDVFDLSVPTCEAFFANGVGVHNCIISGESGEWRVLDC